MESRISDGGLSEVPFKFSPTNVSGKRFKHRSRTLRMRSSRTLIIHAFFWGGWNTEVKGNFASTSVRKRD